MKTAVLVCLALACIGLPLMAQQTSPSTEQMIEQLRVPRTRSLRNLTVEATPEPKRSLSLFVQFDFNSARVRPESLPVLASLANAVMSEELRTARFSIEGHTDAKGSADQNLKLSVQRAQSVKAALVGHGVDGESLITSGKGSTELANHEKPFASENRRVRIVNLE